MRIYTSVLSAPCEAFPEDFFEYGRRARHNDGELQPDSAHQYSNSEQQESGATCISSEQQASGTTFR